MFSPRVSSPCIGDTTPKYEEEEEEEDFATELDEDDRLYKLEDAMTRSCKYSNVTLIIESVIFLLLLCPSMFVC